MEPCFAHGFHPFPVLLVIHGLIHLDPGQAVGVVLALGVEEDVLAEMDHHCLRHLPAEAVIEVGHNLELELKAGFLFFMGGQPVFHHVGSFTEVIGILKVFFGSFELQSWHLDWD